MKNTQDISDALRQIHVPASSKLDERVHAEIANAARPADQELTFGQIIALLMKNKSVRYTLATTLGLALMVVLVLNHFTSSAWAMDQAIEAIKKYRGIHITGYYTTTNGPATPLDLWARSDATGNWVETGRVTAGDMSIWARDNKTYGYFQSGQKGYFQPGINIFSPWLGPKLLGELSRMKDYNKVEGDDPATGQRRVIVTCSLEGFEGPRSFLLEFDVRTKLPVTLKAWSNLSRVGTPLYTFENILYFDDLPDTALNFEAPAGTQFAETPLEVPDANLSVLGDPKYGISADGMTQEEACKSILEQAWTAALKKDGVRLRQLCPVVAKWSDEQLGNPEDSNEVVAQIVKIGGIEQTGSSRLGPLALVSCRIRYKDGTVRENWMLVQFRGTGQGTSCVVVGPRGYGLEAKE